MKGFRTFFIAASLLVVVYGLPEVQQFISKYPTEYTSVIAALMIILRTITTTPMFKDFINPNDEKGD